ncbi:MAG: hypothetical protein M8353_04120 [ANME-2 cluster archaeon]|nr:hypothetical protein [ANME-2 cluster archaeon]
MNPITESEIEEAALEILSELDYGIFHGPDISPDGPTPEQHGYSDVILIDRLRNAINRFNSHIPPDAREESLKKILSRSLICSITMRSWW